MGPALAGRGGLVRPPPLNAPVPDSFLIAKMVEEREDIGGVRHHRSALRKSLAAMTFVRPLYADFLAEAAEVLGKKELSQPAALMRQSGQCWSKLADLAAETADDMAEVTQLARRRMTVVMTLGRAGAEEIKALSSAITAAGGPGPDPALLGTLAELVDAARTIEERAVALMAV